VRPQGPPLTVDVVLLAGRPAASVLLIERANPPFAGQWALPGGFVELGERVLEGALRELAEETGVALAPPLELLGIYDDPARDPRGPTVSVVYIERIGEELAATGGDDATRAAWFPLHTLPPLAFDHAAIIADATREASGS
jgi:8-oxo-dGTP diphosphatase